MDGKGFIYSDDLYFNNNEHIIELESCPRGGNKCEDLRDSINHYLLLSRKLLEEKQYTKACTELLNAYKSSFHLKSKPCKGCAGLFRTVILESMHSAQDDLKRQTSGIFKKKKLLPAFEMVNEIIREAEQIKSTYDNG